MVGKTYVEQRRGIPYAKRERTVGIARRGRARRVVVHEDCLCGEQFEGALDYEPVVYDGGLHAALTDAAVFDDAVR